MRLPPLLRIVLGVLFAGMGVAHFVPSVQRGMRAMIPPALRRPGFPSTRTLVVVTGVCELAAAAGLQLRPVRRATGILLVAFLAAVFPANAYAASDPERFGRTAIPLRPRLVGQVVLGALVLVAAFA